MCDAYDKGNASVCVAIFFFSIFNFIICLDTPGKTIVNIFQSFYVSDDYDMREDENFPKYCDSNILSRRIAEGYIRTIKNLFGMKVFSLTA